MPGLITDLSVAARLGARAAARRLRREVAPEPDHEAFITTLQPLFENAPRSIVRESRTLQVSAGQPPWVGTGMMLEAGETVSIFARGRVYANRALDVWMTPALQLWCRIGPEG